MGQQSTNGAGAAPVGPPLLRRPVPAWIVTVLLVAALAVGFLLGRPSTPLDNSPEAGFLRDMSVHHAQAVDMSLVILEKTDDETLSTIAEDIARTQGAQVGRMHGWLVQWDLSIRGGQPSMAWMAGHGHADGQSEQQPMPGYVSDEDMDELRSANGEDAEVLFLTHMVRHHVGGIEMAEAAESLADDPLVTELASGMADAQQAEIDLMQDMLRDRGAEPVDID